CPTRCPHHLPRPPPGTPRPAPVAPLHPAQPPPPWLPLRLCHPRRSWASGHSLQSGQL
ncbi:SGCA isoform 9, partial [Pongo abelii]